MVDLKSLIASLVKNEVKFIIVDNLAMAYYGSERVTQVFDFCYLISSENIERILNAIAPFGPRPRGIPEEMSFVFDKAALQNGTNFIFDTDIGDIDLVAEVVGLGNYSEVEKNSVEIMLFGQPVRIISLEALIEAKRTAGRMKDLLVLPELEALLKLQNEEKEEADD